MRGYLRAYHLMLRQRVRRRHFPRLLSMERQPHRTDYDGVPGGGAGFPELASDVTSVRDAFARFDLLDAHVRFLQGPYEESLRDPELGAGGARCASVTPRATRLE